LHGVCDGYPEHGISHMEAKGPAEPPEILQETRAPGLLALWNREGVFVCLCVLLVELALGGQRRLDFTAQNLEVEVLVRPGELYAVEGGGIELAGHIDVCLEVVCVGGEKMR
jgi:hypothetical protein